MASATLTARLVGDAKGMVDAFDKGEKSAGKLGKSIGGVAKIAGGFVLAQGMLRLPGLISDISARATTLELNMKKVNTVFGDESANVKEWADETAGAMGVTSNKAQALAANFADLLIPMGFTRAVGAEMATEVVGLSGALAEWSGGTRTAAQVSEILAKAMLGEREGLKGLGISITEADVKARLLIDGTDKLTGAALQQAKATATQALIFEKSKDAQAAYAAGAGSAARNAAELTAKIDTMKERLASALQPVLLKIGAIMLDTVIPALETLTKHMDIIGPLLIGVATAIAVFLVPATWAYVAALTAQAIAFVAANIGLILIGVAIAAVVAAVIWAYRNWDVLTAAVSRFAGAVKGKVLDAFDSLKEGIKGAVNYIIDAINRIISAWNRLEFSVSIPFGPSISVGTPDIPLIPRLARGGIVTRPTIAMLGESGPEAVVPLSRGGGLGTTVNIVINALDPRSAADAVVQTLTHLERTGRISTVTVP